MAINPFLPNFGRSQHDYNAAEERRAYEEYMLRKIAEEQKRAQLNPSANYANQLTAQKPQPLPAKKSKVVLLCK